MGCLSLHRLSMGCLSLQFLKACTVGSPMIKIMTVDGRCLKYEAPSIVKEVLMEYPHHALFDSEMVRELGDRARPLYRTLFLQPGHLYFLVPLPLRVCTPVCRDSSRSDCAHTTSALEMSSSNCMPSSSNAALSQSDLTYMQVNVATSQCELAHTQAAKCSPPKRKVSFATAPTKVSTETAQSSVQFLPSPSDGVLRIKMVVSKRQLASVLKGGGDSVSMVEGLLSPLLEASRSDAAISARNDLSSNLSWRPSLESIPESLWPLQTASTNAD